MEYTLRFLFRTRMTVIGHAMICAIGFGVLSLFNLLVLIVVGSTLVERIPSISLSSGDLELVLGVGFFSAAILAAPYVVVLFRWLQRRPTRALAETLFAFNVLAIGLIALLLLVR